MYIWRSKCGPDLHKDQDFTLRVARSPSSLRSLDLPDDGFTACLRPKKLAGNEFFDREYRLWTTMVAIHSFSPDCRLLIKDDEQFVQPDNIESGEGPSTNQRAIELIYCGSPTVADSVSVDIIDKSCLSSTYIHVLKPRKNTICPLGQDSLSCSIDVWWVPWQGDLAQACTKCNAQNPSWDHYWFCCLSKQPPADVLFRRFLWPRRKEDMATCMKFKDAMKLVVQNNVPQ